MNREFFQAPDRTVQQLFDLSGRVAVITGGAGMLGRRHADAIVEAGGAVVVADLDLVRAEEAVSEIKGTKNAETFAAVLDVTDPASVRHALDAVITRFGRVDILVNNAALTVKQGSEACDRYFTAFEDYPLDLWNKALKVNMTGTFLCSQVRFSGRQCASAVRVSSSTLPQTSELSVLIIAFMRA
jgi:NAD(P)-dependent dehydrogenase (short-subunit alcohol dehydrogenase family)